IGVASGKGGVGKSTLTVQLAYALKKQGLSVGILDADVYGPSLQKMLPEDSLPEQKGANITPAVSNGIKYISLAHFRKVNDSTVVRGPIASKIILEFLNHVDWGFLDF